MSQPVYDPYSTTPGPADIASFLAGQLGRDWSTRPDRPAALWHTDGFSVTVEPATQPGLPFDGPGTDLILTATSGTEQAERTVHGTTLLRVGEQAVAAVARMRDQLAPQGPGRIDMLLLHDIDEARLTTAAWHNGTLLTDALMASSIRCGRVVVHQVTAPGDDLAHHWFECATDLPPGTPAAVRAWVTYVAEAYHDSEECPFCRPAHYADTAGQEQSPALHRVLQQIVGAVREPVAEAMLLYADALACGAIAPTERRPAVLAALFPDMAAREDVTEYVWGGAVHRLHLLAAGNVADRNDLDAHRAWQLDIKAFPDGFSIADLRGAFGGDVVTTATAIRTACADDEPEDERGGEPADRA
ncbi:hypothetical protein [Kitasatospora sp. NPDC088779]|uniref:hypothetical protein n=1 Tax=Kitasatospora sp. NPDC088779 TaxID=3154964 RepID=UPI00344AEDEF